MTSVTLAELDRAFFAYQKAKRKTPNRPTRWVLEALKSLEKDRGLNPEKHKPIVINCPPVCGKCFRCHRGACRKTQRER